MMISPAGRPRPSTHWAIATGAIVMSMSSAACAADGSGSAGGSSLPGSTGPTPSTLSPSTAAPSTGSPTTARSPRASSTEPAGPVRSIRIGVGGREVVGRLSDSPTAQALARQLPLTLAFSDFNGQEKHAELPRRLTTEGAPTGSTAAIGDIGYYAPGGTLVFYYRDVGYYNGIIPIGRLGGDDIEAIRDEPGEFEVTITAG